MGEVIPFPVRPEPEHPGVTEDEHARHLARLKCGCTEDVSLEILVTARGIMGAGNDD